MIWLNAHVSSGLTHFIKIHYAQLNLKLDLNKLFANVCSCTNLTLKWWHAHLFDTAGSKAAHCSDDPASNNNRLDSFNHPQTEYSLKKTIIRCISYEGNWTPRIKCTEKSTKETFTSEWCHMEPNASDGILRINISNYTQTGSYQFKCVPEFLKLGESNVTTDFDASNVFWTLSCEYIKSWCV